MNVMELRSIFAGGAEMKHLYQKFMALEPEEGKELADHLLEFLFIKRDNNKTSGTDMAFGAGAVASGAGAGVATAVASGVGVTKLSALGVTVALGSTPIGWALGAGAAGAAVGYGAFKLGKKIFGKQGKEEAIQERRLKGEGMAKYRMLNPYVFYYLKHFQYHVRNEKDLENILESKVKFYETTEDNVDSSVLLKHKEKLDYFLSSFIEKQREECEENAKYFEENYALLEARSSVLLNEALGFLDDLKQ